MNDKQQYWADTFADQIIKSGVYQPYWVDDMKTPSGRVHIGSVRAVVTHDLVHRALVDHGVKVQFSYVLEDHDPMDSLPEYLDEKKYAPHLGKPLFQIPSPEKGFLSYGRRWGEEYIEIFNSIGINPVIYWGSQLYLSGKMNDMVKTCLNQADKIRDIYKTLYGQQKPKNWFPFTVVCEECGKLSTTTTTDWDGELVTYTCNKKAVDWTEGCGYQGKTSPYSTADRYSGKLPWKVEWPCKWKVIGVTVEGAGKDHMSEGGSHDFAKLMCKKVINYPVPFHFSHEFFLIGGRKMSSSKGIGSSAKEVAEIIPAYLLRFLIARVKFNRAINFDPNGMTIPDLFDHYDQAATAFWERKDLKLARIFEFSQIDNKPPKRYFLPRFRDIAKTLQNPKLNVRKVLENIKGSKLSEKETKELQERMKYAKIWLGGYAPEEYVYSISKTLPKSAKELTDAQKKYLKSVAELLTKNWENPDDLQQEMYQTTKQMNIPAKVAFQAIYVALLGKTHGPKAAWLLLEYREQSIERFSNI